VAGCYSTSRVELKSDKRHRNLRKITSELGGIVAENIGPLALYYESTLKACYYENRAVLKRRYESRALLIYCLLGPGGRGGFHTYRYSTATYPQS